MRFRLYALATFALSVACGGGTPAAKEAKSGADVAPPTAMKSSVDNSEPAAAQAPSGAAAPDATSPPKGASVANAQGEDDVWMAPHQMPPSDVLKTVRPALAKVQSCFRAGIKRDPSTTGEVKIRFVISNEGQVRAWRDEASTMSDEDVIKCIGDLVQSLKFPKQKSPGDAWGTYTADYGR
jgi:hypothetical protein